MDTEQTPEPTVETEFDAEQKVLESLKKPTYWTPEKVTELKRLWGLDYSAGHIARQFGDISRNAVIGKIYRLGLPPRPKDASKQATSMRVLRASQTRKPRPARKKAAGVALPPTFIPPPEIDETREGIGIMDLTSKTCRAVIRWPEGSQAVYCGDQVQENQKFCPGHFARYYQPPKLRAS